MDKLRKLISRKSLGQPQRKISSTQIIAPIEDIQFFPRVKNLSDTSFNPQELELLNKGLQYAPKLPTTTENFADMGIHIDAALDESNIIGKAECAKILQNHLELNIRDKDKNNSRVLGSIKNKLANNNLILTKADKGNTTVILKKDLYIEKIYAFLSSVKVTELKTDPTHKFQKEVIKTINSSNLVLDDKERFYSKISNPSIPILYGLVKLHKVHEPIRPVCSAIKAPTQNLCKKISVVTAELLNFKPDYTVKNSVHLIDKVKHLQLPCNAKLVSFDVCNLFPSIPVAKLKDILNKDIDNKINNPERSSQLKSLINICLSQNYFQFDKKIYIQKEGLSMGSAASPFFADYFMNNFEENLFKKDCDLLKYVFVWFRYVDDVFCIWTGTTRQLNKFVGDILNKLEPSLKFTVEIGNNKINFLDISITITENKLEFNIYRKETYSDAIIPSDSHHPWNIKLAAFHSMIDRLLNVPLNQKNFNIELATIVKIAENNGYKKKTIYNLLRAKSQKRAINTIFPNDKKYEIEKAQWRKVPYIEGISEKIKGILQEYDVQPAFFNKNSLKNILLNNKIEPKIETVEKSGVYEIGCDDCSGIYIGKTKRKLKTRYSEHISGAKNDRAQSGLSKHLKNMNHKTSINNIKLLKQQNGGIILDKYEHFEIKKALASNKFVINDQIDEYSNSPLLEPLTYQNKCSARSAR